MKVIRENGADHVSIVPKPIGVIRIRESEYLQTLEHLRGRIRLLEAAGDDRGLNMANHVTTILTIHGERAEQIYEAIRGINDEGGDRLIDFQRIIPMPGDLKIESNGAAFIAEELWKAGRKPDGNHKLWVHRYFSNLVKYGFTDWYRWSVANWGTKWNAYNDSRIDRETIRFDTAWSVPVPVLLRLSGQYPDTLLTLDYADEDIGHDCGHMEMKGGMITKEFGFDGASPEAKAFAYKTKGWDPKDFEVEE